VVLSGEDGSQILWTWAADRRLSVRLIGLTLTRGFADWGGALAAYNTDLSVEDSTLANNRAVNNGGALLSSGGLVLFERCTLYGNAAGWDGGVAATQGASTGVSFVDSTLYSNRARRGGVSTGDGEVFFLNSVAVFNEATEGGGAVNTNGRTWIHSSSFFANSALEGGAFRVTHGKLIVSASTLEANSAERGGGIFVGAGGELDVDGSLVARNRAEDRGGAVFAEPGGSYPTRVQLHRSLLRDNTAVGSAGAFWAGANDSDVSRSSFVRNAAANAGAVHVPQGSVRFHNSTFASNRAEAGASAISVAIGSIQLKNSTLVNDSSQRPTLAGRGTVGVIELAHTILEAPRGVISCDFGAPDLRAVSYGYNVENGTSCRLAAPTDRSAVSASLGPLGYYGGPAVGDDAAPTQLELRPPLPSSTVIDGGSPRVASNDLIASPGCLSKDALGVTRPRRTACDVGAVEVQ
jgi:hypothetical protein